MKKNLRRLSFFIVTFITVISVQGQTVSSVEAEGIAKKYIRHQIINETTNKKAMNMDSVHLSSLKNDLFHLVSFKSGGFVILSGDKKAYPIIGFSMDERLDVNNLPPSLEYWLNLRAVEMLQMKNNSSLLEHPMWENIQDNQFLLDKQNPDIPNFVSTRWDQGQAYNDSCPAHPSGPNGRCYAGCIATAMAQVLNYYQKPLIGSGSNYYHHGHFGTISCVFEGVEYQWDLMTNMMTLGARPHIAQLTYHCGVSVEMNYSPLGSGSYSQLIPEALKINFGYPTSVKYIERHGKPYLEWKQLVMDNLELRQPIIYSGHGSGGGHAWVCSGFRSPDYFYMNWGWSGSGNGFYYLDNLSVSGSDFTSGQSVVVNIAPLGSPFCVGTKYMVASTGTVSDGSGNSPYKNNTDCKYVIVNDSAAIRLVFTEFSTENDRDFVSIYNGETTDSPLLGRFSGNQLPPSIIASSGKMMIHFTSDGQVQSPGWSAKYFSYVMDVSEVIRNQNALVYPNPAKDKLTLFSENIFDNKSYIIEIINSSGQMLLKEMFVAENNSLSLDVSKLSSGLYLLIIHAENQIFNVKFVVQK